MIQDDLWLWLNLRKQHQCSQSMLSEDIKTVCIWPTYCWRSSKDQRMSGRKKKNDDTGEREFSEAFKCGQNSKWNCMHLSVRRIFQFTSDVLQAMGELNHVLLLVLLKDLQLDIQSIVFYSVQGLHSVKGKGKQREEKNKLNGPRHRKQDIPWSFEIKTLMYYCMYTYNSKFPVSPPKLLLEWTLKASTDYKNKVWRTL